MQFLVQSQWLLQEASARKLTAKPATVQKQLDDQIKQSFPKQADYQNFLKSSGMSMQDLLFRVKIDVLTQQVRQKIVAGKDQVSDAQIQAYYTRTRRASRSPSAATCGSCSPRPRPRPTRPRQALEGGTTWSHGGEEVLDRPGLQGAGRQAPGRGQGPAGEVVRQRDLRRQEGRVVGPVKTQFGYYVFKVTAITPASQQTLAQAHDTILNIIRSQQEQKR